MQTRFETHFEMRGARGGGIEGRKGVTQLQSQRNGTIQKVNKDSPNVSM